MSEPIAVYGLSASAQWDLRENGAMYRNGQQVVIPQGGDVDVRGELRQVLEVFARMPFDDQPEEKGDDPAIETPEPEDEPGDLSWAGFEVRGYREDGQWMANVSHLASERVFPMTHSEAQAVLADEFRDDEFIILCAKAFMVWWERNGLDKTEESPLPGWEQGTLVRHKFIPSVAGVVVRLPHAEVGGEWFMGIAMNNGDFITINEKSESVLNDYEEVTEEMGS